MVGRMFVEGAFRRTLNTNLAPQTFEQRPSAAATADYHRNIIEDSAKDFGFHTIDIRLGGRNYTYRNGGRTKRSWSVHIPVSPCDFIDLTRELGAESVAPFAYAVRKTLEPKKLTAFSVSPPPRRNPHPHPLPQVQFHGIPLPALGSGTGSFCFSRCAPFHCEI